MYCQKNIEVLWSFETFYSKNVTEYLVIKLLNLLLKEVLAIGLIKKFKAYHAYTWTSDTPKQDSVLKTWLNFENVSIEMKLQ